MRYKGKFLNKQVWYSICSQHYIPDEKCNMCNTGSWENIYIDKIGTFIYDISPKIWRYLVKIIKKNKLNLEHLNFTKINRKEKLKKIYKK
jgi:hypothetical protein